MEHVRLEVTGYLARFGLSDLVIHRIEVVLEELISNVVRHASGASRLWVAATCDDGALRLSVEDDGEAFDPLARPDPAPYTVLEDAIPGGQGIPLVKRLSRSISYARAGGRNRLCAMIDTLGQ